MDEELELKNELIKACEKDDLSTVNRIIDSHKNLVNAVLDEYGMFQNF